MIILTYKEALNLCKKETEKLVEQRKLKEHCEEHNLSYHGALSFLRGHRKKKNNKLVADFLKSIGYTQIDTVRKITYDFCFFGDAEKRLKGVISEISENPENQQ